MNRLKAWLRVFFGLSRGETNGLLILLPLLCLVVFVVPAYRNWSIRQERLYTEEINVLDSLWLAWHQKDLPEERAIEAFVFNPNTASIDEFTDLGFTQYSATRIENYRKAGGKFFVKRDLLKIYGMDSSLFTQLYDFIDLPEERHFNAPRTEFEKRPDFTPQTKKPFENFNLNEADTAQLKRIYGIGNTLSVRIIKYRDRLGGFTSMNQLYEVYGLDSVVVVELASKSFIAADYLPDKIYINQATEKELAAHPYISYSLAKALTTYRFQHGNFQAVEDVRKIVLVDETLYQKIKPYLSLNP